MATVACGFGELGLKRIVAITTPGNGRSIHLLESLGFAHQGLVSLTAGEAPVCLLERVP